MMKTRLSRTTAVTCSAGVQEPNRSRLQTKSFHSSMKGTTLPPPPHFSLRRAEQPGGSCQPSQAAERRPRGRHLIPETEYCLGDKSAGGDEGLKGRTSSLTGERGGGGGRQMQSCNVTKIKFDTFNFLLL